MSRSLRTFINPKPNIFNNYINPFFTGTDTGGPFNTLTTRPARNWYEGAYRDHDIAYGTDRGAMFKEHWSDDKLVHELKELLRGRGGTATQRAGARRAIRFFDAKKSYLGTNDYTTASKHTRAARPRSNRGISSALHNTAMRRVQQKTWSRTPPAPYALYSRSSPYMLKLPSAASLVSRKKKRSKHINKAWPAVFDFVTY